ncbi:MAG: hypothetical protein J1E16_06535 [Muribaculaceae bacterium]|nr:hypothetical protein [Muribaculaceae bacterium]
MIKIGNSNIVGVSLGDTQFSKIYKGVDLVWIKVVGEVDLSSFIIQKGNESTGDVVLWDRGNQQKLIVNVDNVPKFPTSNYVPIGIVAIPSSQNVYGDNSASMMSLKKMSLFDPDNGCVQYKGTWDRYNGYSDNPLYGYTGDTLGTTVTTSTAAQTFFNQSVVNSKIIASSPGYDWKTASQITNSTTKGSYPAGFCCWRYSTEGTSQGDWYLPSSGELYNTFQKNGNIITNVLTKLKDYGFDTGNYFLDSSTDGNYRIIACSESRYDQCWYYNATSTLLYGGNVNIYSKVVGLTTITAFCNIDNSTDGGGGTITPEPDVTYYDVTIIFDSGINSVTIKSSSMNTTVRNSGEVIKVKEGDTITWSVTYKDGYMEGNNCSGSMTINKNETISISSIIMPKFEFNPYREIHYSSPSVLDVSNLGWKQNIISNSYDSDLGYNRIIFDNDVTEIPDNFFNGAEQLQEINWIPVGILKIGNNFVRGCWRMYGFCGFSDLENSVELGDYFMAEISENVINSIKWENISKIGNYFLYNNSITDLILKDIEELEEIGDRFLDKCYKLKSIELNNLPKLYYIGNYFRYGQSGVLYDSLTKFIIKETPNLTEIGNMFLNRSSDINELDLSGISNVRKINDYFMYQCSKVKGINDLSIFSNATYIGNNFLNNTIISVIDLSQFKNALYIGDNFMSNISISNNNRNISFLDLTILPRNINHIGDNFMSDNYIEKVNLSITWDINELGNNLFYTNRCNMTFIINSPNKLLDNIINKIYFNYNGKTYYVNDELIEQYKEVVPKCADLFKPLSEYNE